MGVLVTCGHFGFAGMSSHRVLLSGDPFFHEMLVMVYLPKCLRRLVVVPRTWGTTGVATLLTLLVLRLHCPLRVLN